MKQAAIATALAGLLAVLVLPACRTTTAEELKASIEVTDVETKWVSKYYQPWPPRLTLVPQMAFRVRNTGEGSLSYVNFNAVFRFRGDEENLGDQFRAAIRGDAVPPGELSDVITMTSNYGVEGRTLDSFKDNPAWRPVVVRLFASSRGSGFVLLGEYDVSRTIDFQEPAAPEIKK